MEGSVLHMDSARSLLCMLTTWNFNIKSQTLPDHITAGSNMSRHQETRTRIGTGTGRHAAPTPALHSLRSHVHHTGSWRPPITEEGSRRSRQASALTAAWNTHHLEPSTSSLALRPSTSN
ncbi:uncharacterized protein LOC111665319 isoform X5 [Seriola lalandi dorsalis]|uniref:uncharacterized protein LOC111665319 isoform X5 n=1 Tax=Seriola lalandi dorsalis TaxID=1841481 RepID=UPI000C6F4C9A|nr:uncharacterized protein LOC111665319 isoform X5 [Seriola lalandi dorsalis]